MELDGAALLKSHKSGAFFFPRAFTSPIHTFETLGLLCPCSHHQVSSGCVRGILIFALLQLPEQDKEVCRHLLCRAGNYMLVKSVPLKAGKASVPIKNKIADIFINYYPDCNLGCSCLTKWFNHHVNCSPNICILDTLPPAMQ